MTLDELLSGVPRFAELPYTEQIKIFAWHLHTNVGKDVIATADIRKCYDDAHLERPASISAYVRVLVNKSPKEILESGAGFRLARQVRESFDSRLAPRPATVAVISLLATLPDRLGNMDERAFLDEALVCFRHGAFRAAIVMAWNLSYDHFLSWLLSKHQVAFNNQLPRSFPKAKLAAVTRIEEFGELKESEVIQVAKSAGVITNDVFKIMSEKLGRRNSAAHPSKVIFTQLQAEDFITDVVNNVVLKLG